MICLKRASLRESERSAPRILGLSTIRWVVAQEGSRETYAIPLAFHRLGALRLFYADIWCRHGRSILRNGPSGARALGTRFNPEIPLEKVVSFSGPAIISRALLHFRRSKLSPKKLTDEFCHFGKWFATRVRDHLKSLKLEPGKDAFFGFNTNCLEALRFLKDQGVFTLVDQVDPARVEEQLVLEEAERWPGWASAPGRMPVSYWNRIEAEWQAADVVMVNSEWSLEALAHQGVPREKMIVVPLALDLAQDRAIEPVKAVGKLKALWLGSVTLRKGIQYLVEAARRPQNENIEFLLAGPLGVSASALQSFPSNMKLLGRITRDQLSGVYRQAHVFVLPTVSDGFAVTQLEAMAHGLPVITTPNCGRVVTDGVDGLIIPARDSLALAEALARLNEDRGLLQTMSVNALSTVRSYDLLSNARLINQKTLPHFSGRH
jgi:glycosyltransferase involved in cell wall biosynthesis